MNRDDETSSSSTNQTQTSQRVDISFAHYMQRCAELRDVIAHGKLEEDAIEEIWARFELVDFFISILFIVIFQACNTIEFKKHFVLIY